MSNHYARIVIDSSEDPTPNQVQWVLMSALNALGVSLNVETFPEINGLYQELGCDFNFWILDFNYPDNLILETKPLVIVIYSDVKNAKASDLTAIDVITEQIPYSDIYHPKMTPSMIKFLEKDNMSIVTVTDPVYVDLEVKRLTSLIKSI